MELNDLSQEEINLIEKYRRDNNLDLIKKIMDTTFDTDSERTQRFVTSAFSLTQAYLTDLAKDKNTRSDDIVEKVKEDIYFLALEYFSDDADSWITEIENRSTIGLP